MATAALKIPPFADVDEENEAALARIAARDAITPAERMRRSARLFRMIAEADEIIDRTTAIVNRLCPPPLGPKGNFWTTEELLAHGEAHVRRRRLHQEIEPRIAAKVRSGLV